MSAPYVGEIRMFGFPRVPIGWQACDGTLLPIADNELLFNLIGTTYGGDGQSYFRVPDLRGRVPLHFGSAPNRSPYAIGAVGGTESVTLLSTHLPAHSHPMYATNAAANATTIGAGVELGALSSNTMYATDVSGLDAQKTNPSSTEPAGGNLPHDNTMPTLPVQFCIAVVGIYPTQS
ncbi:phage tail protein [Ensifer sp. ZNC0028]|uniref:phage tail protein n=1 Tax=Ensifer sp. ZNC0028 TaxID=1339236 RepID=UPI0005BD73B8|nr:tail fiber protein [Ensifer sp. ZNC0028]